MNQLTQSFSLTPKPNKNESEQKVLDLLDILEKDPDNFSQNLREFEEYFFTNKPGLASPLVKRLFFVLFSSLMCVG